MHSLGRIGSACSMPSLKLKILAGFGAPPDQPVEFNNRLALTINYGKEDVALNYEVDSFITTSHIQIFDFNY